MGSQLIRVFILALLVLLPKFSYAAITSFPWSSTFNYGPCTQRGGGGSADCGNVQNDGIYWNWGATSVEGHYTEAALGANHPAGGGGSGFRSWKRSGADNQETGPARIDLSAQKELWVRWYERYEPGFSWNGDLQVKSLYFRTNVATAGSLYTGFQYGGYRIYNQGGWTSGGTGYPETTTTGWYTVYPGGVSNGSWHCYEIHLKMDTDTTNGVGEIWIDGKLVAQKKNVNWSGGDSTAKQGWTWFEFLSNQKDPKLSRAYYADLDDMVIYNSTPPNRDAQGNPFIGPLGTAKAPLAAPTGLKVTVK